MTITHRSITATAALAAALTALPVLAGLRAWEPSDYVQDGLVLNFDGIRNAGLAAAHNSSATTWKDLSPSGNDATLESNEVTTYGTSGWTDNGYMFYRNAWFLTDRAQSFEGDNGDFTIQAVVDFSQSAANLVSFPMVFDSSDGTTTIQAYWNNTSGQKKAYLLADKYTGASGGNASGRPYLTSAWAGHYLTAAFATASGGGKDAWLFEGTTYPTAHPGYVKGGSSSTALNAKWAFGSIVSDSGRSDRLFTGKIQSIRAYSHKLSEAELAWNRAIDEARFFGTSSVPESAICAAAVPDAVIASSVTGANGAEAVGCYVVDEDGHTFRAAPSATVSGATYACTGCTVATWDDTLGAYGGAETRDGVFAVAVAPGDKVKITWQWEAATGALDAGYVTDDLALRLDGIDNAGVGVHNASATVWKDLSGNGRDAYLAGNADGTSYWTAKGFYFNKNAVFATTAQFQLGKTYTIEGLVDSAKSDYPGDGVNGQVFCNSVNNLENGNPAYYGNLYYHQRQTKWIFLAAHVTDATWGAAGTTLSDASLSYFTAFRDGPLVALTNAAALPPSGNWAGNTTSDLPPDDIWCFGANSATAVRSSNQWNFKGTFKSFRAYTRLLTDEELARNRAVDDARFFGNIPASNAVVVASSIAGLEGREPNGIYFPDEWTFTAGTGTNTVRGLGWECAGYQLQTWDADSSTWSAQTTVSRDGASAVEYTAPSAPFATVRLTWLWRPVSGIRTPADYAVADYAAGALAWHLDGIFNAGANAAHDSSATVWSDLSGNGRDATLAGNSSGASAWNAAGDGFFFASNAVFATSATFALGKSATIQVLADATCDDQRAGAHNSVFAMPASSWNDGGIYYKYDGNNNAYYRTDNLNGSAWNNNAGIYNAESWSYLTALRDDARTALVSGTDYPTTSSAAGVAASYYVTTGWLEGTKSAVASASAWRIGASTAGGGANALYGTIKSVRLYDRLLSEDELAWNRSVDSARYFGVLATTNVVVAASDWQGDLAAGAYEVFGSQTFTGAADANFVRVQTLQQDGTWGAAEQVEGNAFTYDASAGVVQIEFRKTSPFVLTVR